MKTFFQKTIIVGTLVLGASVAQNTFAQFQNSFVFDRQPAQSHTDLSFSEREYINQLLLLIANLENQITQQNNFADPTYYQPANPFVFEPVSFSGSIVNRLSSVNRFVPRQSNRDREPDVETESARDISDDSAELRGEVDMNDFRNGIVFFVYGQDEDRIEDVERDYDEYRDVSRDEDNDDFEVVRVDTDLDNEEEYEEDVSGLEEGEEYYFVLCVEYEDEDNDETLECGDVEDFDTDGDSNGDQPEVETRSATNIRDTSAELRGEVDMNDFDNGRVFFVWGENENDVEDADNEDRFEDINEQGDDLQTGIVRTNHDGFDSFDINVFGLDDDMRHYFRICVEYQDNNDDTLECSDIENFRTDN